MSALHVPLTRPQLCGSVFMGWLIPATENGHILALPSTLPLQVSFSLFLSVYCPSLHLPMSNPVLSCGFVWKEKNQTPIKEKKKKYTEHHPASKNFRVICRLPYHMITHFFIIILPIFHTVQTGDLTFWVIHKVQSLPTLCENQQTSCWGPSCLCIQKESYSGSSFYVISFVSDGTDGWAK